MKCSNHAYDSVVEIISDALSHDLNILSDTNKNDDGPFQIKLMCWSDDFDSTT